MISFIYASYWSSLQTLLLLYCFTSLRPTILNVKEFFGDRGITTSTVVRFELNLKYTMIFPLRTLACCSQNVQIYYEYTVENSHIIINIFTSNGPCLGSLPQLMQGSGRCYHKSSLTLKTTDFSSGVDH